MKKLLYLFLTCLLLAGCRGNRYYLDKVEALWSVDYDSVMYCLQKVDSASMTSDEWLDYHYFRMRASFGYLMSMEKNQVDSIIRVFKEHYPMGHERAFDGRLLEVAYTYNRLNEFRKVDSLLGILKSYALLPKDSSRWYSYKYQTKWRLDEKDSSLHYIQEAIRLGLWKGSFAHERQAYVYQTMGQPDSAIASYLDAMEQDTTQQLFALDRQVMDLLLELKDVRKALEYLEEARKRMRRSDIPYYNLCKGDFWLKMHQPDSAMKYYQIATETGDGFMASQAYERMGWIAEDRQSDEGAFRMYHNAQRVWNDTYFALNNKKDTHDFEALKIQNQLSELKVERQRHIILILGLALLLMTLVGGFIFYLFHRKRINERNRLMQENVMLKQQEELSSLREKQALTREKAGRIREELFKRIRVYEKLSDAEDEKHIQLSDADWKELQQMLDSGYDGFTEKLRSAFPALSEKDINFCCLVKINMSIQNLTDIYCIGKNSVSRKKLRLKEKMGIGEGDTLDAFLDRME